MNKTGKTGIMFTVTGLLKTRPVDLRNAVNMIKMHMDSSVGALERHMKAKGIPFDQLHDSIAEIQLRPDKIRILIRDEEETDSIVDIYKPVFTPNTNLHAVDLKDEEANEDS